MRTLVKPTARQAAKRLISRMPLPGGNHSARVVSLLYHSIHPSKPFASATPAVFDQHLGWLQEHCQVVGFSELMSHLPDANGRPVVAITFDDGFADNHEYALPLLAEHRLPATFYVTAGLVMRSPAVMARFARLWGADERDVEGLTWGQIREMQAAGMVFGSHTTTHPNLPSLDIASARRELGLSKTILEDRLGTAITTFAYPFGKPKHNVNLVTRDLVREAGFTSAATVNYRAVHLGDDPFRIPRFSVTGDSVEELAVKVAGGMDVLGVWQQRAPRWLSHLISPEGSHRKELSVDGYA